MSTRQCRHCDARKADRARGLCSRCYFSDGIRELYPSAAVRGVHGGDFNGGYGLPLTATDAAPGTPGKEDVLAERAAQGVALWHAGDEKLDLR